MIYGVDPGYSKVSVACPETAGVWQLRLRPELDIHERLARLVIWYADVVPAEADVVCESVIVGASGNAQTAIKLAMVVGTLASMRSTTLAAPSSWKKGVCGNGRSDKAAVRAWLAREQPALAEACGKSQDLVDAMCLGLYGHVLRAHEAAQAA